MASHHRVLLLDPVLVLVNPQLPVRVHDAAAVSAGVEEHCVLVLALHMVEHVALQLAELAADAALPPLQAALHHAGHVGQEGSISLARGRVRRHSCKLGFNSKVNEKELFQQCFFFEERLRWFSILFRFSAHYNYDRNDILRHWDMWTFKDGVFLQVVAQ